MEGKDPDDTLRMRRMIEGTFSLDTAQKIITKQKLLCLSVHDSKPVTYLKNHGHLYNNVFIIPCHKTAVGYSFFWLDSDCPSVRLSVVRMYVCLFIFSFRAIASVLFPVFI